jgi:tripartite-type tricarboxylate transporter receptor subunit TctC
MNVRTLTGVMWSSAMVLFSACAAAQSYPVKPLRVVIPFPAGGDVETAARFFANHVSKSFGQPVVLEPRPGGNTQIGTEAVAKSAADGYTFLFCGPSTFAINPTFYGAKLPYDYARDFTPVSLVSSTPYIITVAASLPAKNIAELIALARAEPGKLSYVSSGSGSSNHLAYEILVRSAGVSMVHVPYKGMQLAIPDLLAGRVTTLMAGLPIVGSGVRAGKLRAIAVTSQKRFSLLPEVAAVAETGPAGFDIIAWFGLFAPAKTPSGSIALLSAEMRRYLTSAAAQEDYQKVGHEAIGGTPDQLNALVKSDAAKFDRVIREANITLE